MNILALLLSGFAVLLNFALNLYIIVLLARAIISFLPDVDRRSNLLIFLLKVTEPVFRPIRKMFPRIRNIGGYDLTPLVPLLAIYLIQKFVIGYIQTLAQAMGS